MDSFADGLVTPKITCEAVKVPTRLLIFIVTVLFRFATIEVTFDSRAAYAGGLCGSEGSAAVCKDCRASPKSDLVFSELDVSETAGESKSIPITDKGTAPV